MPRKEWRECADPRCGRFFEPDEPEQRFCCRGCAKRYDMRSRKARREQVIEGMMAEIRDIVTKFVR